MKKIREKETDDEEETGEGKANIRNILVISIVALVAGLLIGANVFPNTGLAAGIGGDTTGNSTSVDTVALGQKVADFVNANLMQDQPFVAKIDKIEDYSESLYSATIGLYEDNQLAQSVPIFITKDGKSFVVASYIFDLAAPAPTPEPTPAPTALTCEDVPKEETPVLQAFVVSYCPFGLQMQRILVPVAELLGDNIEIRYIGSIVNGEITAMHGAEEATENHRQICIREEQSDKYWDYVSCFMKEQGKTDECLASAAIDTDELDACMSDATRGVAYAQEDFDLQAQYGASGSPTLILNGERISEFDFATGMDLTSDKARSAENIKNLLCCGFITDPAVCGETLSDIGAATGFAESYDGAGGAGTC